VLPGREKAALGGLVEELVEATVPAGIGGYT